MHNRP